MASDSMKGLSPEEKIKRLKALEEQKKREIQSGKELIRESEEEIELRAELSRVPIPQIRATEINDLFFSPAAKEIFKQRRQTGIKEKEAVSWEEKKASGNLEEKVNSGAVVSRPEFSGPIYGEMIEQTIGQPSLIAKAYRTVAEISSRVSEKGYVNREEMGVILAYKSKLDEITGGKDVDTVQDIALRNALEQKLGGVTETYKAQKSNPKENLDVKYRH